MMKEISNFPVNVMKVVKVISSTDFKSPRSKRLRQIESRTSSVRVVISRAPRNVSTPSPKFVRDAEENAKLINLAIGSEEDAQRDVSTEDQNFEESVNSEESTERNGVVKAEALTRGKLSSKYRASNLMDNGAKCSDSSGKCVRYKNINREASTEDRKTLASNSITSDDGSLLTERSSESGTDTYSHPNSSNNVLLDKEPTVSEPSHNSHLPPGILHQASAQNESPATIKISQTNNSYDTFQEKVKQIREILKEIEYNDDTETDNDFDDYDGETIPAQFKYLRLFEEKYGNSRNGEYMSSFYHNPQYGKSSSFTNSSRNSADDIIVPGMIADFPNGSKDINPNCNNCSFEEVISVSQIEDIVGTADMYAQHDKNEFRITDRTTHARNLPLLETPIWMVRNITEKRLPPTPFSKSIDSGSNGLKINLDEKIGENQFSTANVGEQKTVKTGVNVQPLSPLRSANEKLMKAVENLFKVSADTQIKHKSSTKISYSSHHGNQSSSVNTNQPELNQSQEALRELSKSAKAIPEEISEFNNLMNMGENENSQKVSRIEKNPPEIPSEPVNTFLYYYEDNALSNDPLTDQTPLFLDTGDIESPANSGGDKRKGGFEHFSSNDLDSDRFTSSFSNAQIKMYELYRDQQLRSGSPLALGEFPQVVSTTLK